MLEVARHALKLRYVDRYSSGSIGYMAATCMLCIVVVRWPRKRSESLYPSLPRALPRIVAGTFSLVTGL